MTRILTALRTLIAWTIDWLVVSSALGIIGLLTLWPAIEHEALLLALLWMAVFLVLPFVVWWRASPARRRTWSIGRRVTRLPPFGVRA